MAVQYPQARVKAALTGIVEVDTGTWPAANYIGGIDSDCEGWFSDDSASTPALILTTATLGMVFRCRRAGTPILPYADFETKLMHGPIEPPLFVCISNADLRDAEVVLDNLTVTAGNEQYDIRFGTPAGTVAVQGVGCYARSVANGLYTTRMRAWDVTGTQVGVSCIRNSNGIGTNAYVTGIFEAAVWVAVARDAADAADIVRCDVAVKSGHTLLTDAAFDAAADVRSILGQLYFGPNDPLSSSSAALPSPSRCFATSPGTGTTFVLSRGPARHGRVLAAFARDELLVSDGVETLGVHLRGLAWRAIGRGCTGLFYEADTDATVASFGTATYELEREGTLTDNGSGLALVVETPGVASDAAVPMRLQRLYVEADTRGQSVVPTLVLDETTIALAAFVTARRSTVEYALDVSTRVAGVRLAGTSLADRVDVFGVDLDYYVPEGEPGATFTIPEQPMMMDA